MCTKGIWILPLLMALLGVIWMACGTATLYMKDGSTIEANIIDSDASSVQIDVGGRVKHLIRSNIEDIDHPGNVWAAIGIPIEVAGTSLAVLTVYMASRVFWDEDAEIEDIYWALVLFGLPATFVSGIGAGLSSLGFTHWCRSKSRASSDDSASSTQISVSPMIVNHDERTYYGGGLSLTW